MIYVACERLRWGDGWIEPGQPVPMGEPGRNYAQLRRLGRIKLATDGVASTPQPAKKGVKEVAEPKETDWSEEVKQYHRGFGRYEIPGVGEVQGREAAIEALKNQPQK